MDKRHFCATVVGVAAATVLCVLHLAGALRLVGPYADRADVLVGVALGLLAPCALILVAGCLAASVVSRLGRGFTHVGLLAALTLTVHYLLLFAPLGAFVTLAASCKVQWLCPDYANPIGLALIGVVTPGRITLVSPWVALFAIALTYFITKRLRTDEA